MKTTKLYVVICYDSVKGDKVECLYRSKSKAKDYVFRKNKEQNLEYMKAAEEGTLSYRFLTGKERHFETIKVKSSEKLKKGDLVYLTAARFEKVIDRLYLKGFSNSGLANLSRVALSIEYSFDERDHSVFVIKKKIR